ncbi:anthranilate synthase component I family protein [Angustibacter sp. Root456]|uniref:anthranilate synthase component I family protein n=1 Tax=Angustibacter sp. Root456 TaxID=1736539 RepID=UPI000700A42F|nr:anthranilate synthase component I family protein [Angustibacter sp. Root456]KQX64526.1 hypothetical protein ASD06_10265 [Angustibacter sp. Root456]
MPGDRSALELSLRRHRAVAGDPYAAYLALRASWGERAVFLLESLAGPTADRRSALVGFDPVLTVSVHGERIDVAGTEVLVRAVRAALGEAGAAERSGELWLTATCSLFDVPRAVERVFGAFDLDARAFGFGYLAIYGYDVVQHVERLPRAIPARPDAAPDLTLVVHRGVAVFDLAGGEVTLTLVEGEGLPEVDVESLLQQLASPAPAPGSGSTHLPPPESVADSTTPERFHDDVTTALGHIAIGDIYQVQLGHELTVESAVDELTVYRRLRERNPSPYMAIVPVGDLTMISASPELFLRIEGDLMTMRPIAGTVRRSGDEARDHDARRRLRGDEKEIAEHTMLVDLCRNDLGRVAQVDSIDVDELMVVEDYSHVFHLVSNVTARVVPGVDAQDVVAATFPAGTMTGAPKIRAMEIIEGLEDRRRELYAGAFGLIGFGGYVNLGLCLRTLFRCGTTYRTRASAGVVADSTPDGEWRETLSKLSAAYWAVTGEELT